MKTMREDKSLEVARRALVDKRNRLIHRHAENVAAEDELLSEREPDLPDVAADRTAAAVLESLDDADQLQLLRIGRALKRIDDGSYGTCSVCGAPIAPARLHLVPEADRCATCSNSH
ncbi:MAG TPA: TraR/DksA C4-type zinc finger protein [Polyangia bacterium]